MRRGIVIPASPPQEGPSGRRAELGRFARLRPIGRGIYAAAPRAARHFSWIVHARRWELLAKSVRQVNGKALRRSSQPDAVILDDGLVELSRALVQHPEQFVSQLIPFLGIAFRVFFHEKAARFVSEIKNCFPVGIYPRAG